MTVTGGLDASLYSEALEQQWSLVHDIMAPSGTWLAFVDRVNTAQARAVGKGERDLAGYVAATIAHAQPFFWRASIARALIQAVQTLPDYTFTAESFPCPKGFVWFEEPIQIEPEAPHHAPLRALAWSVLGHRPDPDGVPVLIYAFVSAEPRRAGVPAVHGTIRLGWTLRENLERRADEMLAAPTGATELHVTRLKDGTGSKRWAVRDEPSTVPVEERLGFNRAFHRFLAGCLSFLEQRIATAIERPVSRSARRRVDRSRPMAEPAAAVRVIELRRREHGEHDDDLADGGSEGPAWQCQWIVSGHWQQLRRVPDSVLAPSLDYGLAA